MDIYLDNSATTKLSDEVSSKMISVIQNIYGNPSSLHSLGLEAQKEVEKARTACAEALSVTTHEIFFTSGGTEANNTAVFGAVKAKRKRGNKIVTTMIEHSSVYESCKSLENDGFEVVCLTPDSGGHITEEQIFNAVDDKTILVSVMMVNNEVGTILPVESIRDIVDKKKAPALIHCDAVQAFGKMPVKPHNIGCDLLTVSSHKIHGPKGAGALFIKEGTHIKPLICGGEQQKRIRPGTESIYTICGFGEACRNIGNVRKIQYDLSLLHDYAVERFSKIDGVVFNSPPDSCPAVVNISAPGYKSETMLHYLEKERIFISSGSACSKGKKSHVLKSMGLPDRIVDSALRISFSKYSTKEEIDILAYHIEQGMKNIVKK